MKVRSGTVLTVGLALVVGGCAAAAVNGIAPRDNEYTTTAMLQITQAQSAEDEAVARERYQDALETSLEGIEADSTNPQSYLHAGMAYVGVGDYQGADSMLTRAMDLYPGYEEDVIQIREQGWIDSYNRAIEPMNRGEFEEAIHHFEQANMIYDERPEAYLNLGAAYAQIGETERGARAYERALEIIRGPAIERVDEETAAAWRENEEIAAFNRGQLLAQAGRFDDAVAAYEAFLESDPDNLQAMTNLATVLVQADRREEAMEIYDEILAREDLTSREFFTAGVGLFQIEQYDRAAQAFEAAIDLNPRSRDARLNLAQTYFISEDWDQLRSAAQELVDLDPYNPDAYRFLAQTHVVRDEDQEAVRILERMEELPFELHSFQLQPRQRGGGLLHGQLENRTLEQGTQVSLRIYFNGEEGGQIGSVDVDVRAPAPEQSTSFQADLTSEERVVSYYYEVLSP